MMKTFVALAMFVAVASAQFKQTYPKYTPLPVAKTVITQITPVAITPVAIAPKAVFAKFSPVPVVAKAVEYQRTGEASAPIVKFVSDVAADGFNYAYETGNGIAAQAQGSLRAAGNDAALGVQGSYQYTSPEGLPVVVSYVADENGYQPQSDILPTPHPIPEAILRSIEYIRAHPSQEQKYRV